MLEPYLPIPGAFTEEAEIALHDAANALQSLRHASPHTLADLSQYLDEIQDTAAELAAKARKVH
jgi:hypothetical protein